MECKNSNDDGHSSEKHTVLIAPCGQFCSECSKYQYFKRWEANRNHVTTDMDIDVSQFCPGCRVKNSLLFDLNIACKIYTCNYKNGKDYCYECDHFPCELLLPTDLYDNDRSYKKSIINLLFLKGGVFKKFTDSNQKNENDE